MIVRSVVRGSWVMATAAAIVAIVWTLTTPSSSEVSLADAHLARADAYFEANALADAEREYRQVITFRESRTFWYAIYKLGWIDMNRQRYHDAGELFVAVAQGTRFDRDHSLHRAAGKDYVHAYAELGEPKVAYAAFQRIDQDFAFDMLEILADLYLAQGKSEKAIAVFQQLMAMAPTHSNVCLWQYNIVHAELARGNNAEPVDQIEKLVALAAKHVLPATEQQECHDHAAAVADEVARAYHADYARTRSAETLGYAERLYKAFVDAFPDAPNFAETEYYYAELLWSRAESTADPRVQMHVWEDAASVFSEVAKLDALEPKLRKESAYAAVLGWKNAVNGDPYPKESAAQLRGDKVAIPRTTQQLIEAYDVYIAVSDPLDEERVGTMFLKANTYRRYNHLDEAVPIFEDILAHHTAHETAEYSANLLLDAYNRLGRHGELLALADRLLANASFLKGKPELRRTLAALKSAHP